MPQLFVRLGRRLNRLAGEAGRPGGVLGKLEESQWWSMTRTALKGMFAWDITRVMLISAVHVPHIPCGKLLVSICMHTL